MRKLILAATLSACALPAWAEVSVSEAYVRAVPANQINSAAFMTLTNKGESDLALISATSSAAKTVELHTHQHDNGVMRMRRIDEIKLPAGEAVTLQPGGLHVMLIGLTQPLNPDHNVDLTLKFSDNSEEVLNVPVKSVVGMMPNKTPHAQHHNTNQ